MLGAMRYVCASAGSRFSWPVGVGSSTIWFAVQCRSNCDSGSTRFNQTMTQVITASILLISLTTCNLTSLGVRIPGAQQGRPGSGDRAGWQLGDGGAAASEQFHAGGSESVSSPALCVMAGE